MVGLAPAPERAVSARSDGISPSAFLIFQKSRNGEFGGTDEDAAPLHFAPNPRHVGPHGSDADVRPRSGKSPSGDHATASQRPGEFVPGVEGIGVTGAVRDDVCFADRSADGDVVGLRTTECGSGTDCGPGRRNQRGSAHRAGPGLQSFAHRIERLV